MKRRVEKYCRIVVFMVLLLILKCNIVYAQEEKIAKLTLHAYGDSLGSSGGNVGHAFLTIENMTNNILNFLDYPINSKEIISVSIWPDTMGYGGVYINREMVVSKGIKTTSISVDITKKQYDKIVKNTPKESYYHDGQDDFISNYHDDFWHNCTTYSTKMWNAVVPLKYRIPDGALGVDAPKWIVKKIKSKSGYQESIFTHNQYIDWTDVFYVSKKSELVPVKIEKPILNCVSKTDNEVSLTWDGSTRKLLSGRKNVTEYLIHYYPTDTPDKYKSKTVTSNRTVIKGLQSGKKYEFLIWAVYKSSTYKVNSSVSTCKITLKKKKTNNEKKKVTSVTLKMESSFVRPMSFLTYIIRGKTSDGKEVWKYISKKYVNVGDNRSYAVSFKTYGNFVYVLENGEFIKLDKETGKILVKTQPLSSGSIGSVMYVDVDGSLYVTHPYPNHILDNGERIYKIYKISSNGVGLWETSIFTGLRYFPYKLDKKGDYLYIYFEGGQKGSIRRWVG